MYTKIQKITTKAIIERNEKILLVKDPKGVWELPGGRIEHGERPKESLLRELHEELGWKKITINELIDVWSFTSKIENRHNHFIILVYSCASNEKNIRKNNEYTKYKWTPIQEVKKLHMRDGYKQSIAKYLLKRKLK